MGFRDRWFFSPIGLQGYHLWSLEPPRTKNFLDLGPEGSGMKAWIHVEDLGKEERMVTIILLARYPSRTLLPFLVWVSLLKLNSRK